MVRNVLLVLTILLFAATASAQPKERIRVAQGSISVNSSVLPIGKENGIFAKYGIDLEPIYMGGGMNSLAAVTSGAVDFLAAGSTATVSARLGGADIVIVAVQSERLDYTVFARPEIKSLQDLKGKIVTGTRPGRSEEHTSELQ